MRKLLMLALLSFFLCGCSADADVTVSAESLETTRYAEKEMRVVALINKNSGKFHLDLSCPYAARMAEENRLLIDVPDIEYLTEHGYEPCSRCADSLRENNENN